MKSVTLMVSAEESAASFLAHPASWVSLVAGYFFSHKLKLTSWHNVVGSDPSSNNTRSRDKTSMCLLITMIEMLITFFFLFLYYLFLPSFLFVIHI